jgi:pimeloyl-ACP methyl ester carboxylesterase
VQRESALTAEAAFTSSALRYHLRRATEPARGTAVFVHGGLDGAASFSRAARRLTEFDVVAYDRRGYRGSRSAPVLSGLGIQVDDLAEVLAAADTAGTASPVVVVGHSYGGLVALAAAAAGVPFDVTVAWEPPFPRLRVDPYGHHRELSLDPTVEAESFFRRMVGDSAWDRLGDEQRAERLADGPALICDLRTLRADRPFEPAAITMPVVLGLGSQTADRHTESVQALLAAIPNSRLVEFDDIGHGAHLSSPDRFAALVRDALVET